MNQCSEKIIRVLLYQAFSSVLLLRKKTVVIVLVIQLGNCIFIVLEYIKTNIFVKVHELKLKLFYLHFLHN